MVPGSGEFGLAVKAGCNSMSSALAITESPESDSVSLLSAIVYVDVDQKSESLLGSVAITIVVNSCSLLSYIAYM